MATQQLIDAALDRARQLAAERDCLMLVVLMDYGNERGVRIMAEQAFDDVEMDFFDARILMAVHPDGTVE